MVGKKVQNGWGLSLDSLGLGLEGGRTSPEWLGAKPGQLGAGPGQLENKSRMVGG